MDLAVPQEGQRAAHAAVVAAADEVAFDEHLLCGYDGGVENGGGGGGDGSGHGSGLTGGGKDGGGGDGGGAGGGEGGGGEGGCKGGGDGGRGGAGEGGGSRATAVSALPTMVMRCRSWISTIVLLLAGRARGGLGCDMPTPLTG